MLLGILGGTFDPPHHGHLILASEALYQLNLDKVLWILTRMPPHKNDLILTEVVLRLQMLQVVLADNPSFEISRVDIDRPSPHYAVDTMNILQRCYPGCGLVYLMGGDSLHDLPTWHTPMLFLQACHSLGVMRRPNNEVNLKHLEEKLPGINSKINWIDAPLIEISSSRIRQMAASGDQYRYYVPPAVYDFIHKHHLYRGGVD